MFIKEDRKTVNLTDRVLFLLIEQIKSPRHHVEVKYKVTKLKLHFLTSAHAQTEMVVSRSKRAFEGKVQIT